MSRVLISTSKINCAHQGSLTLMPLARELLRVQGVAVLTGSLVGKSLVCLDPNKPCTTLNSQAESSMATRLAVCGDRALLAELKGVSDAGASVSVTDVAQALLSAK